LLAFNSPYFDLIVTTAVLRFQALKEEDNLVAEDAPAKTLSGDHHKIAVDVEVT
jgi:hypothetical protein